MEIKIDGKTLQLTEKEMVEASKFMLEQIKTLDLEQFMWMYKNSSKIQQTTTGVVVIVVEKKNVSSNTLNEAMYNKEEYESMGITIN